MGTPVRNQGPGRSLPGPDAGHLLHSAGGRGANSRGSMTWTSSEASDECGVRSTCDSGRPTTVTHGQSWSLNGCRQESANSAFVLVRALETSPQLVVRGRVELPTFRFSGRATFGIPASGRSESSRRASSSLLDCLGRARRIKAKPHAVASRALTQRPRPERRQLSRRTGEDQGAAIRTDRTAVRRAISGPLTPVTRGLSRSLADTPLRRSSHVTGPDGTASQADSADSAGSASAVARLAVVSLRPRVRCRALRAGGSWPRG